MKYITEWSIIDQDLSDEQKEFYNDFRHWAANEEWYYYDRFIVCPICKKFFSLDIRRDYCKCWGDKE